MKLPIYMDHLATTPVDPRVLQRMLPFFSEEFGNAASRAHVFGWKAEAAVEAARQQVAALIGGTAREIVLLSGATEANNLALFGVAEAYAGKGDEIISQPTEHKAVLDALKLLEKRGNTIVWLPVDGQGRVDPDDLARAIGPRTVLVSVMLANNEIGTLQPVAELGRVCRAHEVLFHCDAVQGAGKVPFTVDQAEVDLVSLSAHKLYGPKGVGALYVRRKGPRVRLAPQIVGGGHENGMRSGTLNVPGIVGFGEAARILIEEGRAEAARLRALRDRLQAVITTALAGVTVNGHPEHRLPGALSLSFAGVEGEAIMMAVEEVALSGGSACTSATLEPSYVLRALGRPDELARGTVRFGLGRTTTEEEVDFTAERIIAAVERLRALRRG